MFGTGARRIALACALATGLSPGRAFSSSSGTLDQQTAAALATLGSPSPLADAVQVQVGSQAMRLRVFATAAALKSPYGDPAAIARFALERFSDSAAYLSSILGESVTPEADLVIDDLGSESATTMSQTIVGTRVVVLDVRRWAKLMQGSRGKALAEITSVHELTHVATFRMNERESKRNRELIAIVVEGLNFVRLYGEDAYANRYLGLVAAPLARSSDVLGDRYNGNDSLRYLSHWLVSRVLDGTYAVDAADGGAERVAALDRMARLDVRDRACGRAAFDHALAAIGARDSSGARLTLDRIESDLGRELSGGAWPAVVPAKNWSLKMEPRPKPLSG